MLNLIAHNAVLLTGAVILLLCIWGIAMPGKLMNMVRRYAATRYGLYAAAVARVIVGVLLVYTGSISKYPMTFAVLGIIAIVAGIGLPLLGKPRVQGIVEWVSSWHADTVRAALFAGALFGGFLIYGLW